MAHAAGVDGDARGLGTRPGPLRTVLVLAVVLLLGAASTTLAYRLGAAGASLGAVSAGGASDLANVRRLLEEILADAVDHPDPDALVEGALEGMLAALEDPYARYYDPEEFLALSESLDGEFSGIGVRVQETPEGLAVSSVLPDSPAEEAGVEAGERIVSVDGQEVVDLPANEVVDLISGAAGTEVTVGFDGGSAGPREVTMTRRRLVVPAVDAEVLDSGLGHVRLRSFSRGVDGQVREAIDGLLEGGAPGIVLDLRGNPGGLLRESVEVTSLFVEDGLVVRVEAGDRVQEHAADGDAPYADLPLVVLVDGGTASASEIVAGALQDLDRAEVVGQPTFGKGTVQTVQELGDGAGVKFTTARYFTPSGDSIEGSGVTPDLAAAGEPEEQLAAAETALQALVAGGSADGSG